MNPAHLESLEARCFLSAVPAPVSAGLPLFRALAVTAPASPLADASPTLAAVRADNDVVGIVGGVIRNGKLVATGAAGQRRATSPSPVLRDDAFFIGSAGKAMTATLVGRLVDAGKLSWTTTIGEAFPNLSGSSAAYANVTLEQLLGHRSGISDFNFSAADRSPLFTIRGSTRTVRSAYAKYALSFPPAGTPGSDFSYSNVGYIVAAAVIEKVSGGSYEAHMSKWVFKPLGMKSAKFAYPSKVAGHTDAGQPIAARPLFHPVTNPAGRLSMNMGDWAKFLTTQLGVQVSGQGFLRPETLARLQTPLPGSTDFEVGFQPYARGWVVISLPDALGGTYLRHDGTDHVSFSARVELSRADNTALFVAVNQMGGDADAALGDAIAALRQKYLT